MVIKIIIPLIGLVILMGCKKENTPTIALNEKIDSSMATVKTMGSFRDGAYGAASGNVRVYKLADELQLALENFSSSNGPNLKVYLSKELQPVNFIDLGDLKSTSGNQLYKIPNGAIIEDYKYALIYCRQYSHLFGSAELTK